MSKKPSRQILSVLHQTEGVVDEPKPSVYVTDLTADGVNISIYFWINTNENSPLAVFDRVATNVKNVLSKANVEIFPPSSVVVQDAKVQISTENNNGKDLLNVKSPRKIEKRQRFLI